MRQFDVNASDFAITFQAFLDERRGSPADVDEAVADILAEVKAHGLEAVLRFAERFYKGKLDEARPRGGPGGIERGAAETAPEVREAIAFAAGRIRAYHERQRPQDQRFTDEAGVQLGWRWTPLESVGIYVPGGRAAYPSSVLMNAVPATVAGVE